VVGEGDIDRRGHSERSGMEQGAGNGNAAKEGGSAAQEVGAVASMEAWWRRATARNTMNIRYVVLLAP